MYALTHYDHLHFLTIPGSLSANDVVKLSLVQPGKDGLRTVQEFSPKFTYPIFGEAEQIFGYKGLDIGIQFAAHDGSPHVNISYDKKFPSVKSTSALDLNKTLKEFLPEGAFAQNFDQTIQNGEGAKDWRPPGQLIRAYSKKGQDFEIWAGSLLDPRVNQLVRNIQVFVLFFIEAGSLLDLDEVDWSLDRWQVYFTFQRVEPPTPQASSYSFIGYSTTYRFWKLTIPKQKPTTSVLADFPDTLTISPKQLDSRLRISQFLLLPPYQGSGHGSQLYQAIYAEVMKDKTIAELTVEDPSEEFDTLRDTCDWKVIEPALREAKIGIDGDKTMATRRIQRVPTNVLIAIDALNSIRLQNKIAPRQYSRLVEMYLLSLIPHSHRSSSGANMTKLRIQKHQNKDRDDRIYYWWRILMKQRIYRKNKDVLRQLDMEEKYSAIEDSARGQEDEYEGLLMLLALRQAGAEGLTGNGGSSGAASSIVRKRKVVDDDDEDNDSEEVEQVEVHMPKRAKS